MEQETTVIKISELLVKFSNYVVWAVRLLLLLDIILLVVALALGIPIAFMTTGVILALIIGGLLWAPIILKIIKKLKTIKLEW